MKSLPSGLTAYRRTPDFADDNLPAGLRRAHTTKPGVWALIHVLEGELTYRILSEPPQEYRLAPGRLGVVEPEIPHEVELHDNARFFVEFWRSEE